MSISLGGYGHTAGSYKGGTGANMNENGHRSNNVNQNGHAGDRTTGTKSGSPVNISGSSSYTGSFMSMCVNNLTNHEGSVSTLYKDQKNNVTVGIGHLLANADMAAALPFTDIKTGKVLTDSEKRTLFTQYKDNPKAVSQMHLSESAIISLCVSDVQSTEKGLKNIYSGYEGFSNLRKTALVDMAFNIGIDKLKNNFPKFNAAVNRGDWETAAKESHRELNQRGDKRNTDTAAQLRSGK